MQTFEKKTYGNVDPNLYVPKLKEDGTYDAIIRFLPSPDTDMPYAIVYNHGWQSKKTGKWFIENCLRSVNGKCPACENAYKLWRAGDEEGARKRFKKFSAYSNILVVKDPQNPENEGKVFIFRYGKKMFELIKSKMIPPSELDDPLMVFDYYEGANFKLKIRSKIINTDNGKKNVSNYDSSEFTVPTKLGSEEFIDDIDSKLFPLKGYVSPDKFLSYTTLRDKVNIVEGYDEEKVEEEHTGSTEAASDEDTETDESFFERIRAGK